MQLCELLCKDSSVSVKPNVHIEAKNKYSEACSLYIQYWYQFSIGRSGSYAQRLLSYTLCFAFSCLFGVAPLESPDVVHQMSEKDDEEYIYEVLQ